MGALRIGSDAFAALAASPSLADRLTAASNRPSGFDYMRLTLATLIVCVHSATLYGEDYNIALWSGPIRPLFALILPMFFALSGFLVAGSLERCRTVVSFAGLRMLRIAPALAVDTAISALLLGPLFTVLALPDYFADPVFHSYFLNMVGIVHYRLPGVFLDNPWPNVINLQLWTLPYELKCYLAILGLAFIGIAQRPPLLVLFTVTLNAVALAMGKGNFTETTVHGYVLIQCFLYGVCMYLYRKSIPFNATLCAVAALASLALLTSMTTDAWAALPATYMTVYLGLTQPRRTAVVSSGDYSYGIFLYGFPIQQAMFALFGPGQQWYGNIVLSLPPIVLLAMFSWWCVEKPTMRLRPLLLKLEDALVRLRSARRVVSFVVPALAGLAASRQQRRAQSA